jgi:hypothetical protein
LVKKKIFIGIPVFGGVATLTVHSLLRFVKAPTVDADINFNAGDYSVAQARNSLSANFLEGDWTHLLFIDSDLVFTPEDVARVCSHDVPVVGGMYPIKREGPIIWCGNTFPGEGKQEPPQEDGLQRIRYVGTGFVCIERSVLERMREAFREEIEYTVDEPPHRVEWDFWRFGYRKTADSRRRYLTEDWFFCQLCLELGIPVYADTRILLKHIGMAIYPLQTQMATLEKLEPKK